MEMDDRLTKRLVELKKQIELYKTIWVMTAKADGGALFPLDLLSTAVTHRAMCLISGFCDMIAKENFVCAAPLVRLLIDCLLRFYAAWLVDDAHELAIQVLAGTDLRRIRDRGGNKMTDRYLCEQLAQEYPWIKGLYRQTAGYVHLSSKHFFNTIREVHEEDRSITTAIGESDTSIAPEIYEEAVDAMLQVSTAVLRYLHGWGYTKDSKGIASQFRLRNTDGEIRPS
ncbi:MAG: hypothetical protein IH624_02765 [Phycisphaerae bacterium]|nr:hypothetical protein [Phycisphaerae bacterium]